MQTALLRVLEENAVLRLGESSPRPVDVRVLTATHRDLVREAAEQRFRQDLLYRIRVARVRLPALRQRREDLPILVRAFLADHRASTGKQVDAVSDDAMSVMMEYNWPGNVRELENAVEHALVMAESDILEISDLPLVLQNFDAKRDYSDQPVVFDHLTLEEVEKRMILNALKETNYNHTRAAKLLGITRRTLGYRIQKYQLEAKRPKPTDKNGPTEEGPAAEQRDD